MSHMLPESGDVMSLAGGQSSPAPAPTIRLPTPHIQRSENKELLRQQLLSAKERHNNENKSDHKVKQARNRQKNRWKLKFHHQALPQEYLDHYEQTLQKQAKAAPKAKGREDGNKTTKDHFKAWTHKVAPHANMASKGEDKRKKTPAIAPSKIITYDDLPYMGEMTLNNSKPRRGRKPKKADICHLIYENYGTVVPGQPPPAIEMSDLTMCPFSQNREHKTELQNKIISSLLEKKIEKNQRRELTPHSFGSPNEKMPEAPITIAGPLHSDEEPLNLCIRDLHELKIQIQKKFGNIYNSPPEVKTEIDETCGQSNAISVIQRNTSVTSNTNSSPDLTNNNLSPTTSESNLEGDKTPCLYWPNMYMHPLALQTQLLYYQRLAQAGQLPIVKEDQDIESTTRNSPPVDENKNKLVLKEISELLDPKVVQKIEETKQSPEPLKRASPLSQGPIKRKRSAIFIPPVSSKNNASPTAEVSICKFKFTGGSKPSLQEKKMLSVDAGGNFRYYNGTGTKVKGYDYMQRDPSQVRAIESQMPKETVADKEELTKKKRKSRKSLQREKLEQTFKEKGFLIQTQQLQSAEGATYCKFRQLRKFTRYLFRSWKDYLPGELDDKGEGSNSQYPPASAAGPTAGHWS